MSVTSGMNAIAHAVEGLYAPDTSPIISLMAEGMSGHWGRRCPVCSPVHTVVLPHTLAYNAQAAPHASTSPAASVRPDRSPTSGWLHRTARVSPISPSRARTRTPVH